MNATLRKLAESPLIGPAVDAGDLDIDEANMSFNLKWADGRNRDGVGDVLEVSGIDTSRHRANPIILFDHGKQVTLPIGMAEHPATQIYSVNIDPEARVASARVYVYQGNNEHAKLCEQLFDLVVQRVLRAGSFAYALTEWDDIPADYTNGTPAGKHIKRCVLLEASAVVLPANPLTTMKALSPDFRSCGKKLVPTLVKSLLGGDSPAMSYWARKRQARVAATRAAMREIAALTWDQTVQVRDLTTAAKTLARRRASR